MEKRFSILPFFVLVLCSFSHGLSILHGTIECRSLCERTFPPHTYPGSEQYLACQQGCYRALRIDGWSLLGIHLQKCSQGCNDGYSHKNDVYACNLGCEKGHAVNGGGKASVSSSKTTPAVKEQQNTVAALILRPVSLIRSYGCGMINKLTYYVQSSTSYYFSTKDGGMVVVSIKEEPKVYVEAERVNAYEERSDNEEASGYSDNHGSWIVLRRGHHWIHCVAYRSGVPMWILTSILFLSSFFLLWLCCASTSTAPSTKVRVKKAFLIKDFLSEKKSDQDVPLLDLDEEEQAEPLPSKTDASIINI